MSDHVCPWWMGYFLLNPLRKLVQNPERLLGRYVTPGITVLDVGCAMGFFTLPLARLVQPNGKVIAADIQERMLRELQKRAISAGLAGVIVPHLCPAASLGLDAYRGLIDFANVYAVVHEIPDHNTFFAELAAALKPGGQCLLGEPRAHVNAVAFAAELAIAKTHGLEAIERPAIWGSHAALLRKNSGGDQ